MSEQSEPVIVRGRKDPHDHPRIRSNQVPLLGSTQKEMKIGHEELVQILLSHFGKCLCLVPARAERRQFQYSAPISQSRI